MVKVGSVLGKDIKVIMLYLTLFENSQRVEYGTKYKMLSIILRDILQASIIRSGSTFNAGTFPHLCTCPEVFERSGNNN